MTNTNNNQPLLSGDWGASHWELFAADHLPDNAICSAVGCVAIIDIGSQTVAMTRNTRSQQAWEMPAGHTEAGEQPWDTLCREAYEEAGFIVGAARLFAYRKIVRSATVDPDTLGPREQGYPQTSYLPYYYATTTQARVPFSGEEISETRDFTVAELREMAARGEVQVDEVQIIELGLRTVMLARKS